MSKLRIYLMGLLTLLMVPLAWLLQGMPALEPFFRPEEITSAWTLIGIELGLLFGAIMLIATSAESAKVSLRHQIQLIRSFRLSFFDCLFLSLCAGLGEEFLFRIAVQEWLHPLPSAVLFVAIHGYIHPRDRDVTKYGLMVLVFIVILSYAVNVQGIWFCIAAHASYDFLLFYYWSSKQLPL